MNKHTFTITANQNNYTISCYSNFSSYFGSNGVFVEPQTRHWFSTQLKKDDIIFDIGANIGLYSILFSQFTDNTYSFEPTDTYENFLLPNLQANNINNLKTFKLALGEKSGSIDENIYMIWGEQPVSSRYEFITLDDFTSENKIIPKYIKIDVDGFDFEVLKAGQNLLKNNDIIICVEFNYALHTRGHKESDILELMESLDYEHFMTLDNENYFFRKKI